jgi:uncharacterized membrane protein
VGPGSTGYKILLVVHLLSVVFGFGPMVLNGLYGAQAKKRKGPGGLAIGEANFFVSGVAEKIIYTVPIWGIGLVAMSDGVWKFSQAWIGASLALYIIAIAISHIVMIPSAKKMNELSAQLVNAGGPPAGAPGGGPPPQVAEMEALGKKLAIGGTTLNLFLVTIIVLMVFKPGV